MKSMNGVFVSACLCAAVFAACPLFATECIWNGASGAWGSQNGWQNGIKPSATGDTVVIKGADVAVTVGDSNITNFELVSEITIEETGSQLIIDTSSEVNSPAVFNGKGALVKKGVSLLNLTTPGKEYRTLLGNLSGGIIVSNGTLQLPNRTESMGYNNNMLELGRVEVSGAGVLSLGNSPTFSCQGLWGDGTVTNANSGCQVYLYNSTYDNPPVFSGRLMPNIQLTPYYTTGKPTIQYLTGTETAFDITLRLYGILGFKTLGNDGKAGSLGTGPIGFRGEFPCLRCLNESDESTTKTLAFQPDASLATIDAYERGGVTFNGEWRLPAYTGFGDPSNPDSWIYNTIVLTGSNTNSPNIVAATMYDNATRSTIYWRKEGIGIWRFAHASRNILGTMEVRRGTLQCESIAEKGTYCSVGSAARTGADVSGQAREDRISSKVPLVPYAYRLGNSLAVPLSATNEYLPTFEYVGADPGTCRTRPFAVDGVGRVLSTGGALTLAGAFAFTNGTHTLVLDGAGASDRFMSVTNGPDGQLAIVKRGAGTWRLASDIDIAKAASEQGTLTIGSVFSWFRWTIRSNNQGEGGGWIAAFNGFALMDKDGKILNGTLGAAGMSTAKNGKPEQLLPGEMCYNRAYASTGDRYPSKSFHWLADSSKFEGTDASIDVTVKNDDSSTHPVLYFRPDEGVDVAKYDVLACGNTIRAVAQWELAGSMDCTNWVVLHTVNADNMPAMPMAANTWYSTKTATRGGYNIHVGVKVPSVAAAEGATVEFVGTAAENEISTIVLDAAKGAGTIRGGRLATMGTVEIVNTGSLQGLPSYVFDGVGDCANISNWGIACNGNQTAGSLRPNADGSGFRIIPRGMIVIFH